MNAQYGQPALTVTHVCVLSSRAALKHNVIIVSLCMRIGTMIILALMLHAKVNLSKNYACHCNRYRTSAACPIAGVNERYG